MGRVQAKLFLMPQKDSSSSVILDVNPTEPQRAADLRRAEPNDPFRILILGDFSGKSDRAGLAGSKPRRIDRDNFDDVMRGMGVQLPALNLSFNELADFDPDSLFRRCDAFRNVAAPERTEKTAAPASPRSLESDVARLTSGSLLDDIVEQADAPARGVRPRDELQSLIENVVSPHLVAREDQETMDARARSLTAQQALMRGILHDPRFQALEAAWRALDLLVRRLDTDGALSIEILDATKQEVIRGERELRRLLVQETVETPGAQAWGVIIGNYVFNQSCEDALALAKMAAVARDAGAPFIAEAEPPSQASAEWESLRKSRDARWIGLALPRFLGRLPYGRATYAIESFAFEEIESTPQHSDFLWTNPAFACALLLGRSFNDSGWSFRPGADREISGLPYFTYVRDGETQAQPCAEVLLTDSEIDYIQEQGFMALASIKNRDAVFLMRFQSIADPLAGLSGRWLG